MVIYCSFFLLFGVSMAVRKDGKRRPEGAARLCRFRSEAEKEYHPSPRALPWAMRCCPVGAFCVRPATLLTSTSAANSFLCPLNGKEQEKLVCRRLQRYNFLTANARKSQKITTPSTPPRTALAAVHAIVRESTCFVGSSCCVRTGIGQPTCFVSISQRALCLPHQLKRRCRRLDL